MSIATRFNDVSRVFLAFLLLDIALVDTALPLAAFVLFTDLLAPLPPIGVPLVGVAAWILSAPGIAAAFAAFRDAPLFRFGESAEARRTQLARTATIAAIAPPYWSDAEDTRVIRPYFRTYVRLLGRSLSTSVTFGGIIGVVVAAAFRVSTTGSGSTGPTGFLLAVAGYTLLAELVALVMVVEFPRARLGALVRHGYLLTARRWYWSIGALGIVLVLGYALLRWPFLVLIFGSGLLLFFLFHVCANVVKPVRELIIAEETAPPGGGTPAAVGEQPDEPT